MLLLLTTTASVAQLPVWLLKEASGANALFTFADNGTKRLAKQTPSLAYFPYQGYPNGSQDATWLFSAQHNANPTVPSASPTPTLRFYMAENASLNLQQPSSPRRNFNDATQPASYPNVPIAGSKASNIPSCYTSNTSELDLEGATTFAYPDVLTMPAPGGITSGNSNSCDRYYSIWYRPGGLGNGSLMSYVTDYQDLTNLGYASWWGTVPICRYDPNIPVTPAYSGCFDFPSTKGKVAVARPSILVPNEQKQSLYLLLSNDNTQGAIYFFQVAEHVSPTQNLPLQTILTGRSPLTPTVPQTLNEARCITRSTPGCATANFESPELEISTNNQRLAWAEGNKLYVATITDGVAGYGAPGSNGITVATATLSSAGTINGLEFAPGTYDVYVAFDATTNTLDGLYKFTYNSTTNSYSTTATPIALSNARDIKNSYIEADRLGHLVMLSPTTLESYDVTLATPAFLSPVSFAAKTPPAGSTVRRLPRQIDGWHYGYAGDLSGPATVQTIATPANCASPVPSQPITGQATYSIANLGLTATYNWTVTPSAGVSVNPIGSTATVTFPLGVTDTYEVRVQTTYFGQTACGRSSDARLSVTTTNGCTSNGNRFAQLGDGESGVQASNELVVWPNPATDEVSILAPDALATTCVMLQDMQGQVILKRTTKAGQPLTLTTTAIPTGVYLLTGTDNARVWRKRLIIAR